MDIKPYMDAASELLSRFNKVYSPGGRLRYEGEKDAIKKQFMSEQRWKLNGELEDLVSGCETFFEGFADSTSGTKSPYARTWDGPCEEEMRRLVWSSVLNVVVNSAAGEFFELGKKSVAIYGGNALFRAIFCNKLIRALDGKYFVRDFPNEKEARIWSDEDTFYISVPDEKQR